MSKWNYLKNGLYASLIFFSIIQKSIAGPESLAVVIFDESYKEMDWPGKKLFYNPERYKAVSPNTETRDVIFFEEGLQEAVKEMDDIERDILWDKSRDEDPAELALKYPRIEKEKFEKLTKRIKKLEL